MSYEKRNSLWKKVESMTAEERIRWELENGCSCGFLPEYEYRIPNGHYSNCPLHNPENEMWTFWEGIEEGFVMPKSTGGNNVN